jgi:DNA-binding NarL/FixJ family response regulator
MAKPTDKQPRKPVIRVAIVEDHADLRESWREIIEETPGMQWAASYANAEDALAGLPGVKPDVVLMDINLPGLSGIECTNRLKSLLPDTQVLIMTVYDDTDSIFAALSSGATGYLLKRSSSEEMLRSIRDVHAGGSPMTSQIARKVVWSFSRPPAAGSKAADEARLSQREREILDLLAQGFVTKEVADKLGITLSTAQTHMRKIYSKLHVHTRTEAVLKYLG